LNLVLLPGRDGTGYLFGELLSSYEGSHLVIPLPETGSQDYPFLAEFVSSQFPKGDFILLVESFSGGIVPELLRFNDERIKGVIFVASFLSSPNKLLLSVARMLPIKLLASLPLAKICHKYLFLGNDASNPLIDKFIGVLNKISEVTLKKRMAAMKDMRLLMAPSDIPVAYIQALDDKLVRPSKGRELSTVFKNIDYYQIKGSHFILQSRPEESANVISQAMAVIDKSNIE
jgi:hypothetical protein